MKNFSKRFSKWKREKIKTRRNFALSYFSITNEKMEELIFQKIGKNGDLFFFFFNFRISSRLCLLFIKDLIYNFYRQEIIAKLELYFSPFYFQSFSYICKFSRQSSQEGVITKKKTSQTCEFPFEVFYPNVNSFFSLQIGQPSSETVILRL